MRPRVALRATAAGGMSGAALLFVACELVLPIHELSPADDAACGSAIDSHNCGSCGHDCRGGDCVAGDCQPVQMGPRIDSLAGFLALDPSNVYFGTYSGLYRCAKTGCSDGGPTLIVGDTAVIGVAVDDASVYWVNNASGAVRRCALTALPCDAGSSQLLATATAPQGLSLSGGNLYWTTHPGVEAGSLVTCDLNATGCSSPITLASDPAAGLQGIVATNNTLYWAAADTKIHTCNLPSCNPKTIAQGGCTPTNVGGVATDDASVYWGCYVAATDSGMTNSGIYSCPLAGCRDATPTVIEQGALVFGVAVDDQAIYWLVSDASYGSATLWVKVR